MNILINEKLVKRNARIGQVLTIFSLAILASGMYLSFQRPDLFGLSVIALLVGFLASQIGIYYTNRWGRRPRPDEMLTAALKGMDKRYALFHYLTPTSHLLVGPAGIWILIPKTQRGVITYEKNRWRQRGGGFLATYLKIFAQESIGRPDLEVAAETDALGRYLEKHLDGVELPEIKTALVFMHPDADVQVDDEAAPTPTLLAKKLKDFIRKAAKDGGGSLETIKLVRGLFEGEEQEDQA